MDRGKLDKLYDLLKLKDFTFVDIGAAGGFDARWRILGNRLRVIGFEPNEPEFNKLIKDGKEANIKYYNCSLAMLPSRSKFFVLKKPVISSFLRPRSEFLQRFKHHERFDITQELSLDSQTLDNVLASQNIDFIKILTQGSELDILKGAPRILQNICGLQITVAFSQYYQGQPLFSEVDTYLRQLGFSIFHFRPCYWKRNFDPGNGRGQVIFADALYLKDYVNLDQLPLNPGPCVIAAFVYKKYDFAIELIRYFHKKGLLNQADTQAVESIIPSLGQPFFRIPDFPGRSKIVLFLEKMLNSLTAGDWARYENWD